MKVNNKSAVPVLEDKSEEGNTHAGTVVEENDGSEQNRSSQADKLKGSSQGTTEEKPGEDEAKDAGSDSDTDSDSDSDSDGEKEEVPREKETLVEDRSEAVLQEEMSQKPVQSSDGKEEQTPEKEANIDGKSDSIGDGTLYSFFAFKSVPPTSLTSTMATQSVPATDVVVIAVLQMRRNQREAMTSMLLQMILAR
jgi:hypothetical protein